MKKSLLAIVFPMYENCLKQTTPQAALDAKNSANPQSSIVLACVIAVIVHGSLYPYSFHFVAGPANPLATLIDSWAVPPTGLADLVANLLLYVPLGFFAALSLGGRWRLAWTALLGFALSTIIETAQFYDAGRVTNMSDVYLNTTGAIAGGLSAILLRNWLRDHLPRVQEFRPVPLLLLLVFVAWRLFPYVPTIDVHKYWHSIRPVVLHPRFSLMESFRYFVTWLVAGYLLTPIFPRRTIAAMCAFGAFVFSAKIAIVGSVLNPSELIGALLAFLVGAAMFGRSRMAACLVAPLMCVLLVVTRLEPFIFHSPPKAFGWIPFASFLQGSLDTDLVSFLEKVFLYGASIWIVAETGVPPWLATIAIAALLLGTSVLEIWLPGRSGELTDAVMALLIGATLGALNSGLGVPGTGSRDQNTSQATA